MQPRQVQQKERLETEMSNLGPKCLFSHTGNLEDNGNYT